MKYLFFFSLLLLATISFSQDLQFHYDFRHSIDSKLNDKNFPSISFEYFKTIDTLESGSFLFKMESCLSGKQGNTGKVFTQITQNIKFWKPKIYLSVNYSGGLGITSSVYGFYIANSYAMGFSVPFQWKGAWFSTALLFRYNAFDKASFDPQFTFYLGKGLFNYHIFISGSFVFWTQNRDQGNEYTHDLKGKKLAFFGDPQIWFRLKNKLSIGSKLNVYYHLLIETDQLQIYPTIGFRYKF